MIDVILQPTQKKIRTNLEVKSKKEGGDSPLKSLLKTISWRIVGTIDTITISFLITGEVKSALSIGSIEVVSKMILYYFHERAWSKSKKMRKPITKLDKNGFFTSVGSN